VAGGAAVATGDADLPPRGKQARLGARGGEEFWVGGDVRKSKQFFFEKKNQKTFVRFFRVSQ
jgi:hypothetical protein